MKSNRPKSGRKALLPFLFTLLTGVCARAEVPASHHVHNTALIQAMRYKSQAPDSAAFGKWENVIPEAGGGASHLSLGMQTVHSIMLPSGKILLSSGSSWRNLAPVEYYPQVDTPAPGQGCFNRYKDPFRKSKLGDYYQLINNAAIYDPEKNTFYRIPSPFPADDPDEPDHFLPNDFFCSGHIPLPDGNPLFIGGTQYYFPFRTGARTSYIFDWRKELSVAWPKVDWRRDTSVAGALWSPAGLMQRGRWYPTLVPLMDGRFAVFSGFVGFQKGYPEMYQFEINHYVEFFDPKKLDPRNLQAAWKSIDVKDVPHSPFATVLKYPQKIPNICYESPFYKKLGLDASAPGFVPPCDCPERCIQDNKKDAFKLYPHNYLVAKNKVYMTREGDWVSLRTPNTEFMRRTFSTYWMDIGGTPEAPSVGFKAGPDRPDTVTSYGTTYLDPNTGDITLLGGQPTSAGTFLPLGSSKPNHFAGGLGSRKMEQFHLNKEGGEGYWTLDKDFMGTEPQDDRTMQYAIILPTRQILIINGGNYDFYGGVLYPILLTPQFDPQGKFLRYEKKRMVSAVEPRLYHNAAMLMPDGRVWTSGGNAGRATVHTEAKMEPFDPKANRQPLPNPDLVDLDIYFHTDGSMAKQEKGMEVTPIENWTAEFFHPPYLFIDGKRQAEIVRLKAEIGKSAGKQAEKDPGFAKTIGGKNFYLLRSNRDYAVELKDLPAKPFGKAHSLVLLKQPSVSHGGQWGQRFINLQLMGNDGKNTVVFRTPDAQENLIVPGFYLLYYVDRMGKPSKAQMVRFDDQASEI
ncbi:MAG TPA: galactose oxidase-like domain-containing protein [Fibrobacteria bacterium]|nr:galactose oxidase-like domain-containing protein [Fibrobacteria bacterium]